MQELTLSILGLRMRKNNQAKIKKKNIVRNILPNTLTYFGVENVSSCVDYTLPMRGFEKGGSVSGVVDETVDVE